jgi:hypothetical protein
VEQGKIPGNQTDRAELVGGGARARKVGRDWAKVKLRPVKGET